MADQPVALSPALPSELLAFILAYKPSQTTLLVCKSREDFFSSLADGTVPFLPEPPTSSLPQHASPRSQDEDEDEAPPSPKVRVHPLLIPTLRQAAIARHVKVVFVPTVTHLRAWLNVFPSSDAPPVPVLPVPSGEETQQRRGKRQTSSLLVVYALLELHRDGSEWSAQGLGNTIANLVEAGWRSGRRVLSVEQKIKARDAEADTMMEGEAMTEGYADDAYSAMEVWNEKVPILNGSVRRAGLHSIDGAWSGRTVEVGKILSRWFKFSTMDWAARE